MKHLLLVVFVMCFCVEINSWRIFHHGRMNGGNLGAPKTYKRRHYVADVQEEWLDQNLDHFDPTNRRTWKQRFFSNHALYNGKGPVFLMIGGEGEASIKWMTQGSWVNYAEKFGAVLFQVEHRYYGKSHPTEDLSTDNLKFLTSQQALADLANFIAIMNSRFNFTDTKWIAFGGSYSGSLAAWLRAKYPHLVYGAVSASGPLLAEVDFQAYYRIVSESLATSSADCVTAVKQGIAQIGVLLKQPIGQQNVNQLFNLCDPIQDSLKNNKDVSNFYESVADNFAGVVQYNKDRRISNPPTTNITIDVICAIMVNQTIGPAVNRLGAVNHLLLTTNDEKCLDYKYDKMLETLRGTSWDSDAAEGSRQWIYQTCTEFGFYQTSSLKPHVFGDQFPVDFFIDQCSDIYGSGFDDGFLSEAVQRTNLLYGGLEIDVSNVVFVHGSIDPWHALGITKTINKVAPAIFIEGTAHCADMYPPSDSDLPELKAAREQIQNLIGLWLDQ